MALSQDLRLRIVDLVASGVSRREAARYFKVSASSAVRFVKQVEEVGHVEVKTPKKRRSRLDQYRADIIGWIGKQPDLTLAELCARLDKDHSLQVGSSTLDDWLRVNQITYKKTAHASEQERSDVRAARSRWRKRQDWLKRNLLAHKVAAAQAAIKERGAWLLFLPPYSPDLNPIELAFSKLKAHMKRLALRTVDELWKGVG